MPAFMGTRFRYGTGTRGAAEHAPRWKPDGAERTLPTTPPARAFLQNCMITLALRNSAVNGPIVGMRFNAQLAFRHLRGRALSCAAA
jgi:hypothetical protein